MNQKKLVLFTVVLLIGAFIAGSMFYKNQQATKEQEKAKNTVLQTSYSMIYGKKDAPVTIVEFFDPACGTCAEFSPLLKKLVKQHDGKLKLMLRYAPLHPNSDIIVTMLEAAREQGKYWEALNGLFSSISYWAPNHHPDIQKVWQVFSKVGVDVEKISKDMEKDEIKQRVQTDINALQKLGITKTPSFYVNGEPLRQFGYKQLVNLVESHL